MRGRWTIAGVVFCAACGPLPAEPIPQSEGSTTDSEESSDDGADSTGMDSTGADSSGEPGPEPLPCINLEPSGDICYGELMVPINAMAVALSDQDGDGRLDLVVASRRGVDEAHGALWLAHSDAWGRFGEPERIPDSEGNYSWLSAMGPGPDGVARVFSNRSVTTGFISEAFYGTLAGETFIDQDFSLPWVPTRATLAIADLDGDGARDIAVSEGVSVVFAIGGPGGHFEFTTHDHGAGAVLMRAGDEDGDGAADLLMALEDPEDGIAEASFLGYWSPTGPGPAPSAAPPVEQRWLVGQDLWLEHTRLLDLDGDGRLDLWARGEREPGRTHDHMVVALGTEDGFGPQVETFVGDELVGMEPMVAPVDGPLRAAVRVDTDLDELWLMSVTDGYAFEPQVRLGLSHDPEINIGDDGLRVADLNGDGYSDFVTIVAGSTEEFAISVLLSQP